VRRDVDEEPRAEVIEQLQRDSDHFLEKRKRVKESERLFFAPPLFCFSMK
jgi:hypothetical protein